MLKNQIISRERKVEGVEKEQGGDAVVQEETRKGRKRVTRGSRGVYEGGR